MWHCTSMTDLPVMDVSTNFDSAVILSETTIQPLVRRSWSWAGPPPPELVLDPRSGRGVGKVECAQQYDFHGIATTAEAHWENGLAERHHAILANMFEKLNVPSAIFVACDASQKCLKATVNTGSVLRRSTFGTCLDDSVHAACRQLALVLLPLAWIQAMMLRRRP